MTDDRALRNAVLKLLGDKVEESTNAKDANFWTGLILAMGQEEGENFHRESQALMDRIEVGESAGGNE